MSNDKVIRAWKDEQFRRSLTDAERAALLPSPVGAVELTEAEMVGVLGGLDLIGQVGQKLTVISVCPLCTVTDPVLCGIKRPWD
jgi:mersacidin/lichenicidin family type 2 lantibiotic